MIASPAKELTPQTAELSVLCCKYSGSPQQTFRRGCKTDIVMQLAQIAVTVCIAASQNSSIASLLIVSLVLNVIFLIWASYLLCNSSAESTSQIAPGLKTPSLVYAWIKMVYSAIIVFVLGLSIIVLLFAENGVFGRSSDSRWAGLIAFFIFLAVMLLSLALVLFVAQVQLGRSMV